VLSVYGSRELGDVVTALKAARRDIRNDIARGTREVMNPVWRQLVSERAFLRVDEKVLGTGVRIMAGNPPTLVAAASKRRLRGGLVPAEQWHALEFGADRDAVSTYTRRSRNGGTHQVKRRHTTRQLPARTRHGHVVFPAAREIAPRMAALWVQIIVRKFSDAAEGR